MTNIELVRSLTSNTPDMLANKALELYQKRQSAGTNLVVKPSGETIVKWLFSAADTALVFNIGDLLVSKRDGEYLIVKSYHQQNYGDCEIRGVIAETKDGDKYFDAGDIEVAKLPPSILELARKTVSCPNISNCPLKDEGACMKGE